MWQPDVAPRKQQRATEELDHADRDNEQLGRRQPVRLQRGELGRVLTNLPSPKTTNTAPETSRSASRRRAVIAIYAACPLRELSSS